MSFFSSASRPSDDDDRDPPDRTALWFGAASLAFLVAGGSFALPHMLGTGEQASSPVVMKVASSPQPSKTAMEAPVAPAAVGPENAPSATSGGETSVAPAVAEPPSALRTADSDDGRAPAVEPSASPPVQAAETSEVTGPGGATPQAGDAAPLTPQDGGPASGVLGFAPAQSLPSGAEPPDDAGPAGATEEASAEAAATDGEAGTRAPVGELQPAMTAIIAPAGGAGAQQGAPADASAADAEGADVASPEARPASLQALPAPKPHGEPFTITVSAAVRARGADSFQIGNEVYRLSSIEGLGIDKRCEIDPDGRCVFHPRGALKKAIVGATLTCRAVDLDATPKLVDCVKTGQQAVPDVTGEVGRVVASEKARPAGPAPSGTSRAGDLF
jgi:hypothetical protein